MSPAGPRGVAGVAEGVEVEVEAAAGVDVEVEVEAGPSEADVEVAAEVGAVDGAEETRSSEADQNNPNKDFIPKSRRISFNRTRSLLSEEIESKRMEKAKGKEAGWLFEFFSSSNGRFFLILFQLLHLLLPFLFFLPLSLLVSFLFVFLISQ